MTKKLIPVLAVEKLLKDFGAKRVSEDAKEELKKILEEYAKEIAQNAVKMSKHAGRKTVKSSDIKIAIKN